MDLPFEALRHEALLVSHTMVAGMAHPGSGKPALPVAAQRNSQLYI
jgi:hypothetical protein